MRLSKISYQDTNWQLDGLDFGGLSLLIGKNSAGKSRTIMTIDLLVKFLTQARPMAWGAKWNFTLEADSGIVINYAFATQSRNGGYVSHEEIMQDGNRVLTRRADGSVRLYNRSLGEFEVANPPSNKLSVQSIRDLRKYPYIEAVANWADSAFGFKFGNISPRSATRNMEYGILTGLDEIPFLFHSLHPESKTTLTAEFNSLGYNIVDIQFHERGPDSYLSVRELGLEKRIPHYNLSQGMFRSLAILIYIEYLKSQRRASTLIVDDLCEGLDYDKAIKLGKIVFQKCQSNHIQLIASSNDSHLMDVVDIDCWNLLRRDGKVVKALNIKNAPTLFEKFRFTGLSNFDFFASDYILQHQQ